MRNSRHVTTSIACVLLASLLLMIGVVRPSASVEAQEADAINTWLGLVNDARLEEGLSPYAFSSLLTDAAQRHADDVAAEGFADADDVHLGSDGTDEQERIAEAGYEAWTDEDDEALIVGENVWSGQGAPADAMASFLEDEASRDNVLSDVYREIGVGAATGADGRSYYVLTFGARPNVLPIFLNDGAASTENLEVAIRLTNEEARPEGEGMRFIGEVIEIRISNEPSFDELSWESWAPLVPWTLSDTPGEHTVYVQFRDAAGRTAAAADAIVLDKGMPLTPTSAPSSPTPEPTAAGASASPTLEIAAPSPTPEPSPVPPTPSPLAPTVTPFPTWTPLPSSSPESSPESTLTPGEATAPLPAMGGYGRMLSIIAALQGVAVVLGLYLALRRGRSG